MDTRKQLAVAALAFHLTLFGAAVQAADTVYAPVRTMPRSGIGAAQVHSPKASVPIAVDQSHEGVRAMPRTNVVPMNAAAAVFANQPRGDAILLASPADR
jgi:hypothetical protein